MIPTKPNSEEESKADVCMSSNSTYFAVHECLSWVKKSIYFQKCGQLDWHWMEAPVINQLAIQSQSRSSQWPRRTSKSKHTCCVEGALQRWVPAALWEEWAAGWQTSWSILPRARAGRCCLVERGGKSPAARKGDAPAATPGEGASATRTMWHQAQIHPRTCSGSFLRSHLLNPKTMARTQSGRSVFPSKKVKWDYRCHSTHPPDPTTGNSIKFLWCPSI